MDKTLRLHTRREGAKVIIAERNHDTAMITLNHIIKDGGTADIIQTDVSKPEEINKMIQETEKKYKTIDVLINNAGISEFISPYDISSETWDNIINTNLRSVFLCSREAAMVMRKRKQGSIVNIASTRALMSEPNSEAYAASKGGIVALTHALAASFSKDNIQVNCISPGWIETGNYDNLRNVDHLQHYSGRVGKPEDIARACLYITGSENNFINGSNLVIDGGMTKKMVYEP